MQREYWINKLNLQEYLEGGYFAETYKSEKLITQNSLGISDSSYKKP
jgi:predicted cupin superfamily sugar epimerase